MRGCEDAGPPAVDEYIDDDGLDDDMDCNAENSQNSDGDAPAEDVDDHHMHCAAALDGGVGDIIPVQLWDSIIKKYKVAQICEAELDRSKSLSDPNQRDKLEQERALAIAEATTALAKLHCAEARKKLESFVRAQADDQGELLIPVAEICISSNHPLFGFQCFIIWNVACIVWPL